MLANVSNFIYIMTSLPRNVQSYILFLIIKVSLSKKIENNLDSIQIKGTKSSNIKDLTSELHFSEFAICRENMI